MRRASMMETFRLAAADVRAPAARRILWRTLALSVVAFVVLAVAVQWTSGSLTAEQAGWIQTLLDVLGGLDTLVVVWFLFPPVATFVAGTMIDSYVDAVERRHYPGETSDRQPSWM